MSTKIGWQMKGEEFGTCNCAWGCPCQFNALPTTGNCEALVGWEIREGHYGDTRLDGVRFARIFWWPGPVHEGNGIRQLILDEGTTPEQREALIAIESGKNGSPFFEIFAAVCPNVVEPIVKPITFKTDRERRQATLQIPGIGEARAEPIKNPVSGEEHRARIELPDGFEYKVAEMANALHLRVHSGEKLNFEHQNTYAQLNAFDFSNG